MAQFLFTAGTIHLLVAAKSKAVEPGPSAIKQCISALHSIGQTWKCASQSGDVLQRLLDEWYPQTPSSDEAAATSSLSTAAAPQAVDMQHLLQENPTIAQQLQQLGWAPPNAAPVTSVAPVTANLETLLTYPRHLVSPPSPHNFEI